ncbi:MULTISPECIES: TetR/AcrR family transcriptional regulator [unclassified Fusibacter]|uniref:TetR/AcrR family transcriptional regulator n=1 Tax=unclassified Fusibacter TaxID=2624464 RepID=UPI001013879E|nr:TetR/AcrR family transcriptional regulator [Fusibacter sp. A1]MCK8061021.1 TetR/AcrR family transcriptional regulator [Fusibacter sp. A2]NPE20525.1 TetR/AcrR family transcriptional regulator [Fusibacter sp. A1]RXV63723.1 TetR/AcrR family transcriptional regulator [Fusibacter sp. A1]
MATINLREKKKEKIKNEILVQAERIFNEKGYENTSMADIAVASDIAVGTIYNYYKSKPEVYISVMTGATSPEMDEDFFKETMKIDDLTDMVMAYLHKYIAPYLKIDSKIMMSMTKAMVNAGLDSPMIQALVKIDLMVLNKLVKAFEVKVDQGVLPESFNCRLHAESIYSIAGCEILYTYFDNGRSMDTVYERIEEKVNAYFANKWD